MFHAASFSLLSRLFAGLSLKVVGDGLGAEGGIRSPEAWGCIARDVYSIRRTEAGRIISGADFR